MYQIPICCFVLYCAFRGLFDCLGSRPKRPLEAEQCKNFGKEHCVCQRCLVLLQVVAGLPLDTSVHIMFSFNFGEKVGAYERIDDAKNERERSSENVPAQEVVATFDQPVFPDRQSVVQQSSDAQHIALTGELTLVKMTISSAQAAAALDVEGVAEADLIPGRYEGGFKMWEGGVDLAAFLARDLKGCGDYPILTGHHVIELGCGHGLPGIVALLAGATVHFADYNKEVLQLLTQPSVLTNWRSQKEEEAGVEHPPVRYFSGDWTELCSLLGTLGLAGTYDIVLTAESIYSLEGSRKLLQCIKKVRSHAMSRRSLDFKIGCDKCQRNACMSSPVFPPYVLIRFAVYKEADRFMFGSCQKLLLWGWWWCCCFSRPAAARRGPVWSGRAYHG
jgi:hypothetical protein